MPLDCTTCGNLMVRVHRSVFKRLIYSKIYKCPECGIEIRKSHQWILHFSTKAHCPGCGTDRLVVRLQPDAVDWIVRGPMRLMYRLLGGRLYHCGSCRLQFYDL